MKKSLIYWFIFLLILLIATSCDVMKEKSTAKSDTAATEQIETKTFRKGDTVTYIVPKVTLKDTTIYTYNRQGTTLKTVYDKSGQIASIDCFASAIEEIKKENRQFQQSLLNKEKDKSEKFNDTWILYLMGGIVLIVVVALWLFYLYIKNMKVTNLI